MPPQAAAAHPLPKRCRWLWRRAWRRHVQFWEPFPARTTKNIFLEMHLRSFSIPLGRTSESYERPLRFASRDRRCQNFCDSFQCLWEYPQLSAPGSNFRFLLIHFLKPMTRRAEMFKVGYLMEGILLCLSPVESTKEFCFLGWVQLGGSIYF